MLDDVNKIKSLDKSNMAGSIELLGSQVEQTWNEIQTMDFPQDYKKVDKIVFSGMGGSSLGAYVGKYLYGNEIAQSLEIVNDYHLPSYVDENTLVIAGSYSGTTEETISCLKEGLAKGAKAIAIATGGTLEEMAKENNIPFYQVNPKFNPCNQPRMGIGYSVFAFLTILSKLNIVKIQDSAIQNIKKALSQNNEKYGVSVASAQNPAKQLAQMLFDRIPVFIAGEFLIGAVHTIRNQLNENAKALAVYFPLPELDHHLLEALRFPNKITENDVYVFFHSKLYSEKITKRSIITKEVVEEKGHKTFVFEPSSSDKLSQIMELINFGSYAGYYLSLLYGIDPSPITAVQNFKKKLAS